MSVTGTVYAAVTKDCGEYAYVDMGWIATKGDHARKSGIVFDLKDAPALLLKLKRAVDKSIFTKREWIEGHKSSLTAGAIVQRKQAEVERLLKMEFSIVKITVEEVDPLMY